MSLRNILFGRPLASSEEKKEKLNVFTGVPVLGLDALASTGYGPEAALTILLPLGAAGLHFYPWIVLGIVAELAALYFSYQQTSAAYPGGGGAYTVAGENLGKRPGLWAAVSLLLDYLLNVSVGIAAGVGAIISAVPMLHAHTLALCLFVLAMLTLVNLRGVRESGMIFVGPVMVFVACIAIAILIGAARTLASGGHPHAIVAPPAIPHAARATSTWLLLGAFANGCTAMTGIEAVSNGVPLFRKPTVPNARRTLTIIAVILAFFLLGLGYLCPAYHIAAMNERQPGYQNILSQLIAAVAGRGIFYYITSASIFIVLTYSAQTSFADFPRVCRLLAEDDFLPPAFANRGRRLVYSQGIMILAVVSAIILMAFGGVTDRLIPLFAIGAFSAFVFSQVGMVMHWRRRPQERGAHSKMAINAIGACMTIAALGIIIVAKFVAGAWITVLAIVVIVWLLQKINRHYRRMDQEVKQPFAFDAGERQSPIVIVPVDGWNRVAEKGLHFGLMLSDVVIALHVSTEKTGAEHLRKLWKEKVEAPAREAHSVAPSLEILDSPYRRLYQPILDFVDRVKEQHPGRLIAVVVPEIVEPHWYEYVLHSLHSKALRTLLYLKGDERIIVVNAPWHLRER